MYVKYALRARLVMGNRPNRRARLKYQGHSFIQQSASKLILFTFGSRFECNNFRTFSVKPTEGYEQVYFFLNLTKEILCASHTLISFQHNKNLGLYMDSFLFSSTTY